MADAQAREPKQPKHPDGGDDPYMQGWFAGMDDGKHEVCTPDDNPYGAVIYSEQAARWLLGLQHGQDQDREENMKDYCTTCEELVKRVIALEVALYGQAASSDGDVPAVISTESVEGRLRDVETVAHSAEGEVYSEGEDVRRPRIEDDLAAAERIEARVVAREGT